MTTTANQPYQTQIGSNSFNFTDIDLSGVEVTETDPQHIFRVLTELPATRYLVKTLAINKPHC